MNWPRKVKNTSNHQSLPSVYLIYTLLFSIYFTITDDSWLVTCSLESQWGMNHVSLQTCVGHVSQWRYAAPWLLLSILPPFVANMSLFLSRLIPNGLQSQAVWIVVHSFRSLLAPSIPILFTLHSYLSLIKSSKYSLWLMQ